VQELRYRDMAFRVFRNDSLQRYRAAFDLAARYTYLAAKAYDYETNLDPSHRGSARGVLEDVMRARSIGQFEDSQPVAGSGGLADALARLRDNFGVLEGQMGINNQQSEDSKISLRWELFRIEPEPGSDDAWKRELEKYRKDDLWQVPEFRRYCRPFAKRALGKQPGLVIDFPTKIRSERNVFGLPLRPRDHAFDPSLYATKICGVGVWFEDYNDQVLARAPRVYLVPAGNDIMTIPDSLDLETREWDVLDQRIPLPHALNALGRRTDRWIPLTNTLAGRLGEQRRFSSFRAYGDRAASPIDESQMTFNNRLVGRSVWNTKWLLIIPSSSLLADEPDPQNRTGPGLTKFINGDGANWNGVRDIKLYFKTFGFSGN
jgi:hypothetical protein